MRRPDRHGGRVTLVGAGPGDPELLTLKAVRVLGEADLVLFDDLVAPEVLSLTRATARRLHVGKRGYRPSCRQEYIQRLMIRCARRGLAVVRLKAGDPLVFGRGGEEIAALRAAGIAVEIVAGVTTALALGAELQCALTMRGVAQSLHLITAQNAAGQLSAALSAPNDGQTTQVVYMGAARAHEVMAALMAAGHGGATPAVAVAALSRPEQQVWAGVLQHLGTGVIQLDRRLPIVIGVGAVFAGLRSDERVDGGLKRAVTASAVVNQHGARAAVLNGALARLF